MLKRFPIIIALFLILAQTQSVWAAASNVLIASTTSDQSLSMSVMMLDGDAAMMPECVKRCDTSTQSFNPLPFLFVSESNSFQFDRRTRYLKAPYPRIDEHNFEIELPPPR